MFKTSKFVLPNQTYICGHCSNLLEVVDVTNNPKHFFNPGQLFGCSCGKSSVWANSVRDMDRLINYCDGGKSTETANQEKYGFCNDRFCGKCYNYLIVIKNGLVMVDNIPSDWDAVAKIDKNTAKEMFDAQRITTIDQWGCRSCSDNQMLLHQGYDSEGGELDGQKTLAQWFKANQGMWRDNGKTACMEWYVKK